MQKLLVLNAGSSSMKFQIYEKATLHSIAHGLAERIFIDGRFTITFKGQKVTFERQLNNHQAAVELLVAEMQKLGIITTLSDIVGVGHRIVQGGEAFQKSILIKDLTVVAKIDQQSKLAPLHNPAELAVVKSFLKLIPSAQNVGVFDTSFHQTMPKINYMYAVPQAWYQQYQVRRYGMHGTSYQYVTLEMQKILKKAPNLIVCHLGNGASLAAIQAGKSINTSMGLTPLAGIMMGTRSGDLDPAIVEYMVQATKQDVQTITSLLNKASGLLAVSGVSSDFRDVDAASRNGNKQARFAIELYAKRVADYIVQYQNDLANKVDALVFTAGIGENAAFVRAAIIAKVQTMQLALDPTLNAVRSSQNRLISSPKSAVPIYVIPTNEEIMIVHDLVRLAKL